MRQQTKHVSIDCGQAQLQESSRERNFWTQQFNDFPISQKNEPSLTRTQTLNGTYLTALGIRHCTKKLSCSCFRSPFFRRHKKRKRKAFRVHRFHWLKSLMQIRIQVLNSNKEVVHAELKFCVAKFFFKDWLKHCLNSKTKKTSQRRMRKGMDSGRCKKMFSDQTGLRTPDK